MFMHTSSGIHSTNLPVAPSILGEIPTTLREEFSSPLPIQNVAKQRDIYNAKWNYGTSLILDKLHPDIQHFLPMIELAIDLGSLSLQNEREYFVLAVRQGIAKDVALHPRWHSDDIGMPGRYLRIITSDILGTIFRDKDGNEITTPDYGMLLIDQYSEHIPQQLNKIRTRLQISIQTKFDFEK